MLNSFIFFAIKDSRKSAKLSRRLFLIICCDSGFSSRIHKPNKYLFLFLLVSLMLPTLTVYLAEILFDSINTRLHLSQGLPSLAIKYAILSLRNCNNSLLLRTGIINLDKIHKR